MPRTARLDVRVTDIPAVRARLAELVDRIERLVDDNASLRDALDLVLAEQRPWWCDDCRHSKCVRARQATLDAERLLCGEEADREA